MMVRITAYFTWGSFIQDAMWTQHILCAQTFIRTHLVFTSNDSERISTWHSIGCSLKSQDKILRIR